MRDGVCVDIGKWSLCVRYAVGRVAIPRNNTREQASQKERVCARYPSVLDTTRNRNEKNSLTLLKWDQPRNLASDLLLNCYELPILTRNRSLWDANAIGVRVFNLDVTQ